MIDIIIRDCGRGEWLGLIVESETGRELFRGSRLPSFEAASLRAHTAWVEGLTGNIVEFKAANGL